MSGRRQAESAWLSYHYVVQRDDGGELFDGFLAYLKQHGTYRSFGGRPYLYVSVDGLDYWTTFAKGAGYIINRKPSDAAGWATRWRIPLNH